jgi:hypothetical protein
VKQDQRSALSAFDPMERGLINGQQAGVTDGIHASHRDTS